MEQTSLIPGIMEIKLFFYETKVDRKMLDLLHM